MLKTILPSHGRRISSTKLTDNPSLARTSPCSNRPVTPLGTAALAKKGVQWDMLTAKEKKLLKSFLATLKKHHPVRVLVTPELAAAISAGLNWNNIRPLNKKTAAYYAGEMRNNRWNESSSMIAVCDDKTYLINGQHRICGVVMAKVSVYMYFCLLPAPSVLTEDGASPRSLSIRAKLEANKTAACRNMNQNVLLYRGQVSPQTITSIYEAYKEGIDLVTSYKKIKSDGGALHGALAFCYGQLSGAKQKAMATFIGQVADGIMLAETDIAYKLREWLSSSKRNREAIFYKVVVCSYAYIQQSEDLNTNARVAIQWFINLNQEKTTVFQGYLADLNIAGEKVSAQVAVKTDKSVNQIVLETLKQAYPKQLKLDAIRQPVFDAFPKRNRRSCEKTVSVALATNKSKVARIGNGLYQYVPQK